MRNALRAEAEASGAEVSAGTSGAHSHKENNRACSY